MSVCVSVSEANMSLKPDVRRPNFIKFSMHVTCTPAPVARSNCVGDAIRYALPVSWMTSSFIVVPMARHVYNVFLSNEINLSLIYKKGGKDEVYSIIDQ